METVMHEPRPPLWPWLDVLLPARLWLPFQEGEEARMMTISVDRKSQAEDSEYVALASRDGELVRVRDPRKRRTVRRLDALLVELRELQEADQAQPARN
jgi:hypothetical protein